MKTFITSVIKTEEVEYEGPKINASSWENAERQAQEQGVNLIGALDA